MEVSFKGRLSNEGRGQDVISEQGKEWLRHEAAYTLIFCRHEQVYL